MTNIKITNGAVVPLENIPAPIPLVQTKLAKAFGTEHTAKLQAVLDTAKNRRWAWFFQKYSQLASVADLKLKARGSLGHYRPTNAKNSFGGYIGEGIAVNLAEDSQNNYAITIHEVTHNIDSAITQFGFSSEKQSANGRVLMTALSELEIDGEKHCLIDAIEKDRQHLKAVNDGSALKDLKEKFKGVYLYKDYTSLDGFKYPGEGYDLPVMVLGGKDYNKYHEYFAAITERAIAQPTLYSRLKNVIPNTIEFFEKLIVALTPDYNEATIHTIKAKFKYNKSGKLLINFNGKYSIKEMFERLQTLGNLSFGAAYSTLMRAVKYGKALQSELVIDEKVTDYETAAKKIKEMAKLVLASNSVATAA